MDSQYENTPRHPKDISALSWSFLLENWNKTNVYEMITHYTSCQQCRTVSNSVNSVNSVNSFNSVNSVNNANSVNSYSAVLPPSPMVFLKSGWVKGFHQSCKMMLNKPKIFTYATIWQRWLPRHTMYTSPPRLFPFPPLHWKPSNKKYLFLFVSDK